MGLLFLEQSAAAAIKLFSQFTNAVPLSCSSITVNHLSITKWSSCQPSSPILKSHPLCVARVFLELATKIAQKERQEKVLWGFPPPSSLIFLSMVSDRQKSGGHFSSARRRSRPQSNTVFQIRQKPLCLTPNTRLGLILLGNNNVKTGSMTGPKRAWGAIVVAVAAGTGEKWSTWVFIERLLLTNKGGAFFLQTNNEIWEKRMTASSYSSGQTASSSS